LANPGLPLTSPGSVLVVARRNGPGGDSSPGRGGSDGSRWCIESQQYVKVPDEFWGLVRGEASCVWCQGHFENLEMCTQHREHCENFHQELRACLGVRRGCTWTFEWADISRRIVYFRHMSGCVHLPECGTCGRVGHARSRCPLIQCSSCFGFGHSMAICKYVHQCPGCNSNIRFEDMREHLGTCARGRDGVRICPARLCVRSSIADTWGSQP
jgi:hypothetical protein